MINRQFSVIFVLLLAVSGSYSEITFYTDNGAMTFEVAQLLIECTYNNISKNCVLIKLKSRSKNHFININGF
jgi:hypothetical protein